MELGQRRGGRAFNPGRVQPGPPYHSRPAKTFHHQPQPIDREKTCPLLLRVFTKVGAHHTDDDFSVRGKEPKDEVQIYTWKDATLRELTDLVKEVAPEGNKKDATLSFAFVYPCKTGRLLVRKVGRTFSNPDPRRPDNGNMSLRDFDFEIGDYLDVAIL